MTATEELRRLLDERGVEWRRTPHYSSDSFDNETVFNGEGIDWLAYDHMNGRVGLRALKYEVTPKQAIDATLGRGTCKVVGHGLTACDDIEFHWYRLNCGHDLRTLWAANTVGMYCPYCGRQVIGG